MKSYAQSCGVASALDLIGERWTLLIIRDLLTGPKRFSELEASARGAGPNMLARRLQMLRENGIIERHKDPKDARGIIYALEPAGEALRPVVLALARWGLIYAPEPKGQDSESRAQWAALAVEAMSIGHDLPGVNEAYEFRIDDNAFLLIVTQGVPRIQMLDNDSRLESSLIVTTDSETFYHIGKRLLSPLEAVVSGKLTIQGDMTALDRCLSLLGLNSVPTTPPSPSHSSPL